MSNPDEFKAFGRWVKARRQALRLTLRDVAALSREVSLSKSGQVSDGYLAQIEGGGRHKVNPEKLITLAAVLGVPTAELLDVVPSEMKTGGLLLYQAQLDATREFGGRRIPLHEIQQINCALDAAAKKTARGVRLRFGKDWRTDRELVRTFLVTVAAPPYLEAEGREIPRVFWEDSAPYVRTWVADQPRRFWLYLDEPFLQWFMYDRRAAAGALASISHWKIDLRRTIASCHFRVKEQDERFGFDDVAADLVETVRWLQTAAILARSAPESLGPLPPLIDPVQEGLAMYMRTLCRRSLALRFRAPTTYGFAAIAAAADMLGKLGIRRPEKIRLSGHDATVAFFSRVIGTDTSPRPPRRKPSQ